MAMKPSLFKKLGDLKNSIPSGKYREAFGDFIYELGDYVPNKKELPAYLKSYEDSRKWQRSAEEALRRGEQAPVPNVKGDVAKDKAIMSYNRHNKGIDKLNDFVDESPIVYELGMDAEKAANWEKLHAKEVDAAYRNENRVRQFRTELDKLADTRIKELRKEAGDAINASMDGNLSKDERKALFMKYADIQDEIDRVEKEYKKDLSEHPYPSSPENPYKDNFFHDVYIGGQVDSKANDLVDQIRDEKGFIPSIESVKPSNQKFVRRFHTTNKKNIPSIMEEGLDPKYSGGGYGSRLLESVEDDDLYNGVYTTAEAPWLESSSYVPGNGDYTLEFMIPKEEYKKMPRLGSNVEEEIVGVGKGLQTVQKGGRTDIFQSRIKPEWLVNIFDGDMKPVDFNKFKK